MDDGALHAPGEEDLVDVAEQRINRLVRHPPERRVLRGVAVGDPLVTAPDEVGAEDHAVPVVLEALRRVHAAHLAEPGRIAGPEVRRRRATDRAVTLDVPRTGPVADDHVMYEASVRTWVAPGPAEARRHSRAVAVRLLSGQHPLELCRRVSNADLEVVVTRPGQRPALGQPEEPQHPFLVRAAATAAELTVEFDVDDLEPQRLSGSGDHRKRAGFAGPDDLMLIQQEDGDMSRLDQFDDLCLVRSQLRLRVAVDRRFADTVRLVADEDVQSVALGGHEAVEVLEQAPDPAVAMTGNLAHRLGERP